MNVAKLLKFNTLRASALIAVVTVLAGLTQARAQNYISVCSSGTIDSNYYNDYVEQTVCLSGDSTGLDAYDEVDLERYQENVLVSAVGADVQLYGTSGFVDSGEQQGGDYAAVNAYINSPQPGWYYATGLYDECDDPSSNGNCGYWVGLMQGYSVSGDLNPMPPSISVATSSSPSGYTQPVTFTATISSGATGYIDFNICCTASGLPLREPAGYVPMAAISGTTASYSATWLPEGRYSVTASYSGNTVYGPGTSNTITQVVTISYPTPATGTIYRYMISPPGGPSGYAPNGNLLNYTDSVNGTWMFANGYDSLNRLVGGTSIGGYYSGLTASWSYDAFGNRTSETFGGTSSVPLPISSTAQYSDGTNHVTSSSLMSGNPLYYDAAGNVQQDNQNQYLYDAEGRVCASQGLYQGSPTGPVNGYIYDAEGTRVAKGTFSSFSCGSTFSQRAAYVLGPSGEQVSELNGTGAWQHTNVYSAGTLIATYEQAGGVQPLYFQLADWLGTKRVQTDYQGANPETCTSLPFGDGLNCAGTSDATEHHLTGKERDPESGNDYFGARYLGSSFGRFLSPDSLNTLDLSHPQKLNRYTYANNNPLTNIDVDGHCTAPSVSAGQVGICVESYIRALLLPGVKGKLAFGDNRGPNPHGGSFRTQTLLSVDPSTHEVKLLTQTPGVSWTVLGPLTGVNNSQISKTSHDDKGNTYFTLTVYGENGYEKNHIPGAPGGWIEMQFSFTVNAKGQVTVSDPETKGYPSVSIYSYDSSGNDTDIWQQTESGNIQDLWGPRKPVADNRSPHSREVSESMIQCALGNLAECR